MEYRVTIFGFSSQPTPGHRVEIYDEELQVAVHEFVSPTPDTAEIEANRWIDQLSPQPIKMYRKTVPGTE